MREIVSPLDGFASPFGPQRGFNPLRIFSNDEPGVWFEANDSTTLFTDVAGTTPVTTPGDAVALQLDKSGRGNHRTQATTAARPLYALHPVGGVRNLLKYTEEFDNAFWAKFGSGIASAPIVTANAAAAPDGSMTADRVQFALNGSSSGSDISQITQNFTFTATNHTGSIWLRSNTGSNFTLVLLVSNSQVSTLTVTPTWQRFSGVLLTSNVFSNFGLRARGGVTSDAPDVLIWGAQLEVGSTATNYQRVGSFLDVSEEGKARRGRIWYNGTSHTMETGTITPGTDKVQVFAGVRKLSDTGAKTIVELSDGTGSGSFGLFNGLAASDNYEFQTRGTSPTSVRASGYAAPTTNILAALGDISGDSAILRVDGVQEAISTADQGTGNFLAYPLYFGARAGTSLFYNGYEDTSIIRFGPNLDDTTISKVESYVASKTPEPTL